MVNVPALFLAELRRSLTMMRRYPVNTVSTIAVMWMFFIGLVYGSKAIAGAIGPRSAATTGTSLVGFLVWFYAITAVMGIAGEMWGEAQTGTLEQVYLSPFGPPLIFITRQVAGLLLSTAQMVGVAMLTILVTKISVHWALGEMIPILLITMFGLYGVGLMLGGLALIFKQIGNFLMILQFALLFITMSPIETLHGTARTIAMVFPLSQGAALLRGIASGRESFASQWHNHGIQSLILCSIIYMVLGLIAYHLLDGMARKRGTIGQY